MFNAAAAFAALDDAPRGMSPSYSDGSVDTDNDDDGSESEMVALPFMPLEADVAYDDESDDPFNDASPSPPSAPAPPPSSQGMLPGFSAQIASSTPHASCLRLVSDGRYIIALAGEVRRQLAGVTCHPVLTIAVPALWPQKRDPVGDSSAQADAASDSAGEHKGQDSSPAPAAVTDVSSDDANPLLTLSFTAYQPGNLSRVVAHVAATRPYAMGGVPRAARSQPSRNVCLSMCACRAGCLLSQMRCLPPHLTRSWASHSMVTTTTTTIIPRVATGAHRLGSAAVGMASVRPHRSGMEAVAVASVVVVALEAVVVVACSALRNQRLRTSSAPSA